MPDPTQEECISNPQQEGCDIGGGTGGGSGGSGSITSILGSPAQFTLDIGQKGITSFFDFGGATLFGITAIATIVAASWRK
ncbi:MAG TPA: hypothetical protein DD379_09640 [Cyanobacteria bacterium UBA11162]|nr:hypothetical protein [Cyanobacteria bacterium UBA11162]